MYRSDTRNYFYSSNSIYHIMVVFTLTKKTGKRYFPIAFEPKYAEAEIFKLLDGFVDTQTAIDASSWCDLATVGEKYEHDKFTIVCEEL